jgi:hypothetical protein
VSLVIWLVSCSRWEQYGPQRLAISHVARRPGRVALIIAERRVAGLRSVGVCAGKVALRGLLSGHARVAAPCATIVSWNATGLPDWSNAPEVVLASTALKVSRYRPRPVIPA